MSIGGIVNRVLDKLLPDIVGDIVGATIDGLTGNYAACAAQSLDAVEDVLDYAGAERASDAVAWLADAGGAALEAGLAPALRG